LNLSALIYVRQTDVKIWRDREIKRQRDGETVRWSGKEMGEGSDRDRKM
jgi:hypothetical protein